jgi:uncharacterized protein (TIGR03067 family)
VEVATLIRLTSQLWVLAVLSSGVARDDDAKKELKQFEGTWTVIEHAHNGRSAPAANLKGHKFVFSGDKLQIVSPVGKPEYQITLDGKTDPKSIEVAHTDPKDNSGPHLGIYKLEKDQLTVALDMRVRGSARPEGFEAKQGSPVMVWVLKREKP